MLLNKKTNKTVDEAGQALEAAAANQDFGVLAVHDLQATMAKKGVDFPNVCRIQKVCNPHQAKKVLERNMEVSTALPCRVSVHQGKDGGREIATILASMMLDIYGVNGLKAMARDVEEKITAMTEKAFK